jgi:glycosyltransferase involved in cell wall biosynthesis
VNILYFFRYQLQASHLCKDVCELPIRFSSRYGHRVSFATSFSSSASSVLKNYKLIKLVPLSHASIPKYIQLALHIFLNRRSFDTFFLYFIDYYSLFSASLFKLFVPSSRVIIKSDFNPRQLVSIGFSTDIDPSFLSRIKRVLYQYISVSLLRHVDYIIVEATSGYHSIQQHLPRHILEKVVFIPNGVSLECLPDLQYTQTDTSHKHICVVGRIGMPFKGHDILIKSLLILGPSILNNHIFLFIGPVDAYFGSFLSATISEYPWLSHHVRLLGEISDRRQLFRLMSSSFALCHPSRNTQDTVEGTPLVIPEALSVGCFVLTTSAVPSSGDYISSEHLGLILDECNIDTLSSALTFLIKNYDNIILNRSKRAEFARSNYAWTKLIDVYEGVFFSSP